MKNQLPTSANFSVNKTKGFTLVELLIVISIISILAVISSAVYSNMTSGANDARRVSDINAIASALETKYDTQYNALANADFTPGTIPIDPKNTASGCGNTSGSLPCQYCVQSANQLCPTGSTVVSAAAPATGAISWYVCANFQKLTNGAWFFCNRNQRT